MEPGGELQATGVEIGEESVEKIGAEKLPVLSIYLIRHGKSGKDKTNPKRGLTEVGEGQVKKATLDIITQLFNEISPNKELSDIEKKAILEHIKFRLYDSGTDRTLQGASIEREILLDAGVPEENIYLPASHYRYEGEEEPDIANPGIATRLEGIRGMDAAPDFRKKVGDPDYQAMLGAADEIAAWALTPEDEIPEGVESRIDVEARIDRNISDLKKIVLPRMTNRTDRTIVIANSHASNVTMSAAHLLNKNINDIGEASNAEGIRLSFYGDGKTEALPFGQNYEQKVS